MTRVAKHKPRTTKDEIVPITTRPRTTHASSGDPFKESMKKLKRMKKYLYKDSPKCESRKFKRSEAKTRAEREVANQTKQLRKRYPSPSRGDKTSKRESKPKITSKTDVTFGFNGTLTASFAKKLAKNQKANRDKKTSKSSSNSRNSLYSNNSRIPIFTRDPYEMTKVRGKFVPIELI